MNIDRPSHVPQRLTRSMTVPGKGPNQPQLGRTIPMPSLPTYPVFSSRLLGPGEDRRPPNVTDAGIVAHLLLARYAIAVALKMMDLQPSQRVLLPAYHCSSMVHPVIMHSAEPVFYRIRDDLTVDVDDLVQKIDQKTRVVVATHYFGFHQDILRLRDLCDKRKLFLIEDCAHAFFGTISGEPVGSFGDCAVASIWKFFPLPHGACLTSRLWSHCSVDLHSPSAVADIRELLTALDRAYYYGHAPLLRPLVAAREFAGRLVAFLNDRSGSKPRDQGNERRSNNTLLESDSTFEADKFSVRLGATSRTVFRHALRHSLEQVERRRRNYLRLLERVIGIPGCHPLFATLPDSVVPFMFPLWVDNLSHIFPLLEDAAVPMQRFGQFLWSGVDDDVCAVSARLSHNLLQLPCHQDLDDAGIDAIADVLAYVTRKVLY